MGVTTKTSLEILERIRSAAETQGGGGPRGVARGWLQCQGRSLLHWILKALARHPEEEKVFRSELRIA